MESNVVTVERENEETTVKTPTVPSKPDVLTFKSIVKRHCDKWSVEAVENLCTAQTQDLIDELATYFV